MNKKLISVIVPCYNEAEALPFFFDELDKVIDSMPEYNFEAIYVDDGSKDATLEIIRNRAKKDKRTRFVSFSRNFGKEAGMLAGLRSAKGDYAVIMDADLQDPPSLLPQMMSILKEKRWILLQREGVPARVSRPSEAFLRNAFMESLIRSLK